MPHYIDDGAGGVFVGNIRAKGGAPVRIPDHLVGLSSARLGARALDIYGNKLDPSYFRPLFIGRQELGEYDRIMVARSGAR